MKEKNKLLILETALIILWGLVPFGWFKGEALLSSHDLGLPVDAARWLRYMVAWNPVHMTGAEWTRGMGGLTYAGISALAQLLGAAMQTAEKFEFIFWFMLPGFTLYALMRYLTRERLRSAQSIISLAAVNFYMFNLFLEAVWRGNKSSVSAYGLIPLILLFFMKGLEKEKFFKYSLLIALFSPLLSTAGLNQPVIAVVVMVYVLFYIWYLLRGSSFKNKQFIIKSLGFCGLTVFISAAVNLYWILPNVNTIFNEFKSGLLDHVSVNISGWLGGASAFSSLANVVRMQAAWTWYQGWCEPYNIYALMYRQDLFFIILSWLMVGLVSLGIFASRNKYRMYFLIITIIGIIFSCGTHAPFTNFYLWMVKNIPFFIAFRSPWYKFSHLTCLGYAYFFGFAVWFIYEKLKPVTSKAAPVLTAAFIIFLNMVYSFPVATGRMFSRPEERKIIWSEHICIPDYVFKTADWLEKEKGFFRTAVVPTAANFLYIYEWDYVSYCPVLYEIISRPLLFQDSFGDSGRIMQCFFDALYNSRSSSLYKVLSLLNAGYILHETDNRYNILVDNEDSPQFIREKLKEQEAVYLKEKFGKWDIYETENNRPHFYFAEKAVLIKGSLEALIPLTKTSVLDGPALIFSEQAEPKYNSNFLEENLMADIVFYKNLPLDLVFDLIDKDYFYGPLEKKELYFNIKETSTYYLWTKADSDGEKDCKLILDDEDIEKKNSPVKLPAGRWVFHSAINLKAGKHFLQVDYESGAGTIEKVCLVPADYFMKKYNLIKDTINSSGTNLVILLNTEDFSACIDRALTSVVPGVEVIETKGVETIAGLQGFEDYKWLFSNDDINVAAENTSGQDIKTNLCFTLLSYEIKRELHVYLNNEPARVIKTEPDVTHEAVVGNITLKPGRNEIKFYTPYAWTNLKGYNVRFGFKGDFEFRPLVYKTRFFVPQSRLYQILVYPSNTVRVENLSSNQKIILEDKESSFFEEGWHEMTLTQQEGGKNYYISLVSEPYVHSRKITEVEIKKEKAAYYKVDFSAPKKGFLVFNDTFHPQWVIDSAGKLVLPHVKINGFANGWFFEKEGDYSVVVKFTVQDLFYRSLVFSAVSLVFILGSLLFLAVKKKL